MDLFYQPQNCITGDLKREIVPPRLTFTAFELPSIPSEAFSIWHATINTNSLKNPQLTLLQSQLPDSCSPCLECFLVLKTPPSCATCHRQYDP